MEQTQTAKEVKELTKVSLNPSTEGVLSRIKEVTKDGRSIDAFVDDMIRNGLAAKARAAANTIYTNIGKKCDTMQSLGVPVETIQSTQNNMVKQARELRSFADALTKGF
jgi:hypothetical protein